jgi:preprotein translocase subunit YajC
MGYNIVKIIQEVYMVAFLEAAPKVGGVVQSIPYIIMLVVLAGFFIFTIRSQKKQEKKTNEMRSMVAVGDEITSIGGIIGKVVSIKDETVVIETSRDGTKIRILKSAIRSVDVRAQDAQ